MSQKINENQIFIGYHMTELDVLRRYVREIPELEAGFHCDVFGNKTRLSHFFADVGAGVVQQDIPFPDNGQYGEAIEYLGTMRGVESAGETLTVYELGAGFAPWLVVANTFAKQRLGIRRARYVAVEADPARLPLIEMHFRDNGLPLPGASNPAVETAIINAAVADSLGELHFSAQNIHDWGGSLCADVDHVDYRGFKGESVAVPARRIDDLIADETHIDLVHIDIQGWEAKSIFASIDILNKKVVSMVIGTHSRVIEGELITLLRESGWLLIYEKPCKFHCQSPLPDLVGATHFDGTQFWVNSRLWPKNFNWS